MTWTINETVDATKENWQEWGDGDAERVKTQAGWEGMYQFLYARDAVNNMISMSRQFEQYTQFYVYLCGHVPQSDNDTPTFINMSVGAVGKPEASEEAK